MGLAGLARYATCQGGNSALVAAEGVIVGDFDRNDLDAVGVFNPHFDQPPQLRPWRLCGNRADRHKTIVFGGPWRHPCPAGPWPGGLRRCTDFTLARTIWGRAGGLGDEPPCAGWLAAWLEKCPIGRLQGDGCRQGYESMTTPPSLSPMVMVTSPVPAPTASSCGAPSRCGAKKSPVSTPPTGHVGELGADEDGDKVRVVGEGPQALRAGRAARRCTSFPISPGTLGWTTRDSARGALRRSRGGS